MARYSSSSWAISATISARIGPVEVRPMRVRCVAINALICRRVAAFEACAAFNATWMLCSNNAWKPARSAVV